MKILKFLFTFLLTLLVVALFAQQDTLLVPPVEVSPFTEPLTIEDLLNLYTMLYAAVVNILTYVSAAFFKRQSKFPEIGVQVIVIALLVGGVGISMGFTDVWQVLLGFVFSTIGYDKILKPIGLKTAKPKKAEGNEVTA